MTIVVAPSILSGDFSRLGEECERMTEWGADWIHVDIMDGHFVPNLTLGPMAVAALKSRLPGCFLDCHLMVEEGWKWAERFAEAGSDSVTIHFESVDGSSILADAKRFKEKHSRTILGIAIKPKTSVAVLTSDLLDLVDMVLVMSVEPGLGGQKMMADCLQKCVYLRKQQCFSKYIQVDGGVNLENYKMAIDSGADVLVAGTAIYRADNPEQVIRTMKS